jgi:hypothetical protein
MASQGKPREPILSDTCTQLGLQGSESGRDLGGGGSSQARIRIDSKEQPQDPTRRVH